MRERWRDSKEWKKESITARIHVKLAQIQRTFLKKMYKTKHNFHLYRVNTLSEENSCSMYSRRIVRCKR